MICLVLFHLCGCSHSAGEKESKVQILNQCSSEIYGIHLEYYLGEQAVGGQMISYNPKMDGPLQTEEAFAIALSQNDFPNGADLSAFGMELFVVTRSQEERPVGKRPDFAAEFDPVYPFARKGDEQKGFAILSADSTSKTKKLHWHGIQSQIFRTGFIVKKTCCSNVYWSQMSSMSFVQFSRRAINSRFHKAATKCMSFQPCIQNQFLSSLPGSFVIQNITQCCRLSTVLF